MFTKDQQSRILDYAKTHGIASASRKHKVSSTTIHKWKKRTPAENGHYAGSLNIDRAMEQLKAENAAMKKILVEKILKEYGITL